MFMAAHFNVLCITNPDEQLLTLQTALLQAGHQVYLAMGGRNAFTLLEDAPPLDVILVSDRLFDMPGIDVVDYISRLSGLHHTGLVLYHDGNVFDLPVDHAAWPRVDVHLQTPIHTAELYDAIFEAYTRRRGYLYSLSF